jgi:lambda repressor-like predicted transcriptional regulator
VEATGTYSNLGHLCKKWADLRKRIAESQARPPLLAQDAPKPQSKRFLTTENVADIVARYEAGETTQQIGTRYGISKTRVGNVLREQSVAIRRQGLSDVQVDEAATLYTTGKSLACLGAHDGVSHTTVATALRRQGLQLRQRPG